MEIKLHEIKIGSKYFKEIISGIKNFELRKNDRNYNIGDIVKFIYYGDKLDLNKYIIVRITYILKNVPEYGLNREYCIFGFKVLNYKI